MTANDLKDAILSNNGVRGVRVALVNCRREVLSPAPTMKWEGVSSLNNFSYEDDRVTVWRAYSIGGGKIIPWSELEGKKVMVMLSFTPF